MSLVNILNIQVLDNPTNFKNPFQFEITFECNAPLKDDLEWRMIYVGSAESSEYDQVLDSIMVGPIPVGVNKFIFSADAPKIELLPKKDLLEVTVVLLSCLYNDKEFVRVGYYVNNEYIDGELRENPPEQVIVDKLQRNILADKPKVTRYTIDWINPENTFPMKIEQSDSMDQQDTMMV
ncbi:histone chaperone [Cokeromyces recurvatus]|uniref:histone chaperone n=1 Tax=Cokeromyces recurvatus TaxID=90255 RepID=UPI0022202C1E|nr:histone chaperone [Cokeromyces recurvatus]KAI7900037.1 histone chaperone [Cokeromyces recurvatus]